MEENEFLEYLIDRCDKAMIAIESIDLYNYETARRRNMNQIALNRCYSGIYDVRKALKTKKEKLIWRKKLKK